jgi:hypothetical protein
VPTEVFVFFGIAFVIVVALLWRTRRGTTGEDSPVPLAAVDRPEPSISNESVIGPHRDVGRPFRVDRGERPPDIAAGD